MFTFLAPILGNIWFKLATYAIAAVVGAALCVVIYANPQLAGKDKVIAERDTVIATMKTASEKDRADFIATSKAKEEEHARNEHALEAKADVANQRTDAVVDELNNAHVVFQRTIDSYVRAAESKRLSGPIPSGSPTDDPAAAFGQLLGSCDSLAGDLAADSERLADQVRALQAVVQADRAP